MRERARAPAGGRRGPGGDPDPAATASGGEDESLPRAGGKAGTQRRAARRVDVQPVPIDAFGPAAVALVDGDVDPGLPQALGEAEAADTAPDDQDAEPPRGDCLMIKIFHDKDI